MTRWNGLPGPRDVRVQWPGTNPPVPQPPRYRCHPWARIPAVIAPIGLIGGWTFAARAQKWRYSAINNTISDLAATNASQRWIMTSGLVLTGICLVLVAAGLDAARAGGRVAMVVGGIGVLGVAALPLPASAASHGVVAFVAFAALAVWPALGRRSDRTVSTLSTGAALTATALSLALLVLLQSAATGIGIGLIERLLAAGEVLWVSIVVFDSTAAARVAAIIIVTLALAGAALSSGCSSANDGPKPFRSVTGSPTAPAPVRSDNEAAAPTRAARQAMPTKTPARGTSTAWSDDFTGPAGTPADPTLLTARTGGNGWGNSEIQTYTARTANAALDGAGHLAIHAIREHFTGTDRISRQWTSARLDSMDKWSFTTGTLSIRMRIPPGAGTWPAFWLMGADLAQVNWPQAGEIDVIEAFGAKNTVYQSVHGPDGTKGGYAHSAQIPVPKAVSISADYHVFSITRSKGRLTFSVDDRVTGTVTPKDLGAGEQWVFDKAMFFVVNLALGGWAGTPTSATASPSTLLVDWVRFAP